MNNRDKKDNCTLDVGRGCKFCSCETEGASVDVCKGYHKLHTTDWLAEMPTNNKEEIFEVRFKNTRRGYYKNSANLPLKDGDIVAVEASPGHDIGIVSMSGDMVYRQMKRVGFNPFDGEYKEVYRIAKPNDIEKWQEAIALEHQTMILSRQIASEIGLNMKIGDVEYQGDKIKAIFYYIADERVDFRELIKILSGRFRVRIEMKQIGARQEAGRIGGLGSCGRELCCASWISSFVSISTNTARAQEISLNPQKLAGQCSKLKCCLIHEIDTYVDARRSFPRVHQPLQAMDGDYHLVKSDILAQTMSFSTTPHAMIGVVTLPVERVKEILALNKQGKKVERLEIAQTKVVEQEPTFVNMIEQESITRFDGDSKEQQKNGGERRSRSGKRGGRRTEGDGNRATKGNSREAGGEQRGEGKEGRDATTKREGGESRRAAPAKVGRGGQGERGGEAGKQSATARDGRGVAKGAKELNQTPKTNEGSGEKKTPKAGGRAKREAAPKRTSEPNKGTESNKNTEPNRGAQAKGKRSGTKRDATKGGEKDGAKDGAKGDA